MGYQKKAKVSSQQPTFALYFHLIVTEITIYKTLGTGLKLPNAVDGRFKAMVHSFLFGQHQVISCVRKMISVLETNLTWLKFSPPPKSLSSLLKNFYLGQGLSHSIGRLFVPALEPFLLVK